MFDLNFSFRMAFGVLAIASISGPVSAADANNPTVIELYQSQGCSSCLPANALLISLSSRADLLPLSLAMIYGDRLGWKDRFADPAYTARQWEYAKSGKRGDGATPQFIVKGRSVVTGSDGNQLAQSIRNEDRKGLGPTIAVNDTQIRIAAHRL